MRKGSNTLLLGTSQGVGPLHWAAHKENEAVALFLIENGADILQRDKEGRTPLSMASPGLAAKMKGNSITIFIILESMEIFSYIQTCNTSLIQTFYFLFL